MGDLSVEQQRARGRVNGKGRSPNHAYVDGVLYEVVGGDERVDRGWEDEQAEARRDEFEEGKRDRLAQLEGARRRRSLAERLEAAVRRVPEDGVSARRLQPDPRRGAGDPEQPGPPKVSGRQQEVAERVALIAHHVAMLERIADEELGLVPQMADGRMLATEQRDRIVWEQFHGVRADVVAREAPYLGKSARTIERARVAEAVRRGVRVRPIDGAILEEDRKAG